MSANKKLGRATDQRLALLKNQTSYLLWYGKLETTFDRAKAIQRLAEKYIHLAVKTYKDTVSVEKTRVIKGAKSTKSVLNDGPKKLAARRKLMACLYDIQETKADGESRTAYKIRTQDVQHPLIEKLFNEYAPKFEKRAEELGQKGGYTTVHRLGTRRGDAAEIALIEIL